MCIATIMQNYKIFKDLCSVNLDLTFQATDVCITIFSSIDSFSERGQSLKKLKYLMQFMDLITRISSKFLQN